MPKPFRVKRGKREIGNYLGRVRGKRLNLQTKEPGEARRRLRLALDGRWPVEQAAADDVTEVLDGKMPEPFYGHGVPVESESPNHSPATGSVGSSDGNPPEASHSTPPAATAPDVADVVNDAAAEALGGARAALASEGVNLSEILGDAPKLLGQAHLVVQGTIARQVIGRKIGKFPTLRTLPDDSKIPEVMGKLWIVLLERWGLNMEDIGPGWMLLLLSGFTAFGQVTAMLEEVASVTPVKAATDGASPAAPPAS